VDSPVEADELDAAVAAGDIDLQPGDAVLIYMGRDAFEASGRTYGPIGDHPDGRPGLGHSGARWLAEHKISILCWDFLDAHVPAAPLASPHRGVGDRTCAHRQLPPWSGVRALARQAITQAW
jgi:kynurenine formamidase